MSATSQREEPLAAGRCDLSQAVHTLKSIKRAHDVRWIALLQERYPGHSDEACLAANLVTVTLQSESPAAQRAGLRLAAELPARYGILVLSPDSLGTGIPRKAGHAPAIPAPRRLGDL
jgi:hypothetical protein